MNNDINLTPTREVYVSQWENTDLNSVQKLLVNGTVLNLDCLVKAVQYSSLEIIQHLLRYYIGCHNPHSHSYEMILIEKALYRGDIEIIKHLLESSSVTSVAPSFPYDLRSSQGIKKESELHVLKLAYRAYEWQIDEYNPGPRIYPEQVFIDNFVYILNLAVENCERATEKIDVSDMLQNMAYQGHTALIKMILDSTLPITYNKQRCIEHAFGRELKLEQNSYYEKYMPEVYKHRSDCRFYLIENMIDKKA